MVARQASLSVGFSMQEYWSGLPFPSAGDLPDPGIKSGSPVLQEDSLPTEPAGSYHVMNFFMLCVKVLQSSDCDSMDCSPPGSSVRGISQARILESVAISSSRDLPHPGIEPMSLMSPTLAGGFFTISTTSFILSILNMTFLMLGTTYKGSILFILLK